MTRLAALLALLPSIALAAPPPKGSPDFAVTDPHSAWIAQQHDHLGRWCCSTGDAALVEERDHDGVRQVRP